MKTKKDITADIDLIIGKNNEVTDDTHMDLVDEISDYITSQQQPSREKIREATEEAYDKWIRLENENVTYLGELIAIELSELSEEAPFDKNDDRCNVCGFINCVCGIE